MLDMYTLVLTVQQKPLFFALMEFGYTTHEAFRIVIED